MVISQATKLNIGIKSKLRDPVCSLYCTTAVRHKLRWISGHIGFDMLRLLDNMADEKIKFITNKMPKLKYEPETAEPAE